jgi:hypothetical protein
VGINVQIPTRFTGSIEHHTNGNDDGCKYQRSFHSIRLPSTGVQEIITTGGLQLRTTYHAFALGVLISLSLLAQPLTFQDPLLDHMIGKWVLRGSIAGKNTTHDIVSEWVLGHQYMRIQEVSREKDARNQPVYDAIILIGRDLQSGQCTCLWLDNTGTWDFTSQAIGRAKRSGDAIAFRFGSNDGSGVNTTLSYDKNADIWQWSIDNETGGKIQTFARVKLTRT